MRPFNNPKVNKGLSQSTPYIAGFAPYHPLQINLGLHTSLG
jgi:hypothetical protein